MNVTAHFWVDTSFSPRSKPQRTSSTLRLLTRLRPRLNPKLSGYVFICHLLYASFCFADLPKISDLWKLYDEKEYSKLFADIYLLKAVVPEAFIPEVYFLEGVVAHRMGYPARVISLKEVYEKKYLDHIDRFSPAQQKTIYFLGVRLLSVALENYRRYLFSDEGIEAAISFPPGSQTKTAPPEGETIRWKISSDAEIWKDEIPSLVLNDLKSLKTILKEKPDMALARLKKMVEEGLQPYEKGILKKDSFYERLRLQLLDLEFDLRMNESRAGLLPSLSSYKELFQQATSPKVRTALFLRLGILNFYLENNVEAPEQFKSFLKLQGRSVWADSAHRYLGEIAMRRGKYSEAIAAFRRARSSEATLLNAYLTYRLSYVSFLLGQHKESLGYFSELFKKEWPDAAPLEEWRDYLLRELAPQLSRDKRDSKAWKEFVGEKSLPKVLLRFSEYERGQKNYKKAFLHLKALSSVAMREELQFKIEKKLVELALLSKEWDELILHCHALSKLYEEKQDRRELEEILYSAALNLDKYYLQSKSPKDFQAASKLSEIYFELFGQRGKLNAEMYKLATPYLKLWGTP